MQNCNSDRGLVCKTYTVVVLMTPGAVLLPVLAVAEQRPEESSQLLAGAWFAAAVVVTAAEPSADNTGSGLGLSTRLLCYHPVNISQTMNKRPIYNCYYC